jgi:NAD(P)-dependent dehydrogenase (short-subunit alcohol dehydrogenase family)
MTKSAAPTASFESKVVLITGANSGIGEAAAAMFRAAGATVYGLARRETALAEAKKRHPEVRWVLGDVTNDAQLRAAITGIVKEAGRLDVLVNNAAIFNFAPLAAQAAADAQAQFSVNVLGLIAVTQAALPALIEARGSIVNIGSAAGHKAVPGGSIYGATKAAVESLTKSWALELAPQGVRVNAIAPGPTETPGFDKLPVPAEMVPVIKGEFVKGVPLARMAAASEIARWIVAVAAPDVTFMTGHVLNIDGGMSLT